MVEGYYAKGYHNTVQGVPSYLRGGTMLRYREYNATVQGILCCGIGGTAMLRTVEGYYATVQGVQPSYGRGGAMLSYGRKGTMLR